MKEKKKPTTLLMTLNHYDAGLKFLELMRTQYPNCFMPFGREKPLKKNIFLDLFDKSKGIDPELATNVIRSALRIYTSSLSYRASLIREGSQRVDLLGNPVELVTIEERTHAKYRSLDLHWKIDKAERPLVDELKERDREYRQKRYLALQARIKAHPTSEAVIADMKKIPIWIKKKT